MKVKRYLALLVTLAVLTGMFILPSEASAENWKAFSLSFYSSGSHFSQSVRIHYDEDVISSGDIYGYHVFRKYTAKWEKKGDSWEVIDSPPDTSEGWIHVPYLDRQYRVYDDYNLFYDTFKEETYEQMYFVIYINDEKMPLGYALDNYEVVSSVISDYTFPENKYDNQRDNKLGELFFSELTGQTDIYVHLKEVTPWVSSSFNGRKVKAYYNNDVMSGDDISFAWNRMEFTETFVPQTGIDGDDVIGWTRTSTEAPLEYEFLETTYIEAMPGVVTERRDLYVYDTVKITVDKNNLPDGYRVAGPGFKTIDMTGKLTEDHVVQLDVEAEFRSLEGQYLGVRWIEAVLNTSRFCYAGDAYTPPAIIAPLPDIPVPPAIPGMVFTGYWDADPAATTYFPASMLMYVNGENNLQPLPGTYTPIYAVSPTVMTVRYDLGTEGKTTDQTSFNIGAPDYEEPVEPTVVPNSGYLFVGWDLSSAQSTDEMLVYEAVYKEVAAVEWLAPVSLDNYRLNINATLPLKFELDGEYDDVQLSTNEGDVELRYKHEDGRYLYMGLFRPTAAGSLTAKVIVNGEAVREVTFEVYENSSSAKKEQAEVVKGKPVKKPKKE